MVRDRYNALSEEEKKNKKRILKETDTGICLKKANKN